MSVCTPMTLPKILVLGASGGLGSRVVKQAVAMGHGVVALVRKKG